MLPKIDQPLFDTILPISKKAIKFRPLLVKEEKLLLLAKESNELDSIVNCLYQIIKNTVITDIDINSLPIVDLQWIFIQLRIRSIGGTIECSVKDPVDGKNYDVRIDLNDIYIKPDTVDDMVKLSPKLGLRMKLPGLMDVVELSKFRGGLSSMPFDLLLRCIKSVYDTESEYPNFTHEEISEFVDSLNGEQIDKLVKYFDNLPKLVLKYSYTTASGEIKTWEVDKFQDFFI